MSQVWPLRTAFKGREEFRLPHYHPRKQRAAVRCDCSSEPGPLSGCPSMGELCPLQSALEACRKSIQLLGVYPSVPSPVEEELTGRGRRLVTFNLQLERSWIPGAPVWNTASVSQWWMAMPSCLPDSSGGSPLPGWLVILTASLGQDVHVPNINDHNSWTGWAAQLPQASTALACWEGNVMALLEFAPCFREVRHSWGCSPRVSSRCSAHTLPTPGAHGDREAAQLSEKNQENEFLNFSEEDFSSFCNKIPYKQNYQWTGNSVICHLASSIW